MKDAWIRATLICLPLAAQAQIAMPATRGVGDIQGTYVFTEAGGIHSPYRVYVPPSWDGKSHLPLVVMLHGINLTHNAAFDREPPALKGEVFREADKHGFILVCPEGYKNGMYGNSFPLPLSQYVHAMAGMRGPHRPDRPAGEELHAGSPPPAAFGAPPVGPGVPPASFSRGDRSAPELQGPTPIENLTAEEAAADSALAEKDVLNVIRIVSAEYKTDPARLYLMGNSMGMMGTLYLAAAYPNMFTAIGPSDGPLDPAFYPSEKLRNLGGVMLVHGDSDPVAPIDDTEMLAWSMRRAGIDTEFVVVPRGGHGDSWYIALPQIFSFFDKHRVRKS